MGPASAALGGDDDDSLALRPQSDESGRRCRVAASASLLYGSEAEGPSESLQRPFLIRLVECFNNEESGSLEILMEAALGPACRGAGPALLRTLPCGRW